MDFPLPFPNIRSLSLSVKAVSVAIVNVTECSEY